MILRTGNTIAHFANRTPVDRGPLYGLLGILRIVGLVLEIGVSIFIPAAAPAATILGSLFQEALDIYSFTQENKSGMNIFSFALGTALNVIPAGFALRGVYGASKNVLRVADESAKGGFKYVVKGSKEFASASELLSRTKSGAGTSVSRISINNEKRLIREGVISKWNSVIKVNSYERALQNEFLFDVVAGSRNRLRKWKGDKMLNSSSGGRNKFYSYDGELSFSNQDLSIVRHLIKKLSEGKISSREVAYGFRKLSDSAKESIGLTRKIGSKLYYWKRVDYQRTIRRINRLRKARLDAIEESSGKAILNEPGPLKRAYNWFGTQAPENAPLSQKIKTGNFWTQTVQASNPNDLAREVLNRSFKPFIKRFRNWGRAAGKRVEDKFPLVAKIARSSFTKKIVMKYHFIREELAKVGTIVKDDTFLMGWRVIENENGNSLVKFYFNPINTSAKTIGSLNYGGKKTFTKVMPNHHLNALASAIDPGKMYLKGGNGYGPIALSPGGKRAVDFSIENELLDLISLVIPINPLRNLLSVISNFKGVIRTVSNGTYGARWKPVFLNTLTRLLPNKITQLVGSTLGSLVSHEMEGHAKRLLTGLVKGFEKTQSSTKTVNGVKLHFKKTVLSGSFNYKPLVKQSIPQSFQSAGLRRAPSVSRTTNAGVVRQSLKYKRYGTNFRRVAKIPF